MTEPHVAVVGGGVSGLAAAYRLRMLLGRWPTITVVEQTDRVGGKLRTVELGGRSYDVGAEAFLARRREATELITEIGLGDELVHPTSASATIRAGGRINRLPAHTFQGVPASAETVRGVLSDGAVARVADEPSLPPIHLDDDEDVSVGELLRERFGPEVTNRLVDPLLGGVYAGHADGLSLRATMAPLANALDRGAGSLVSAAASLVPAPRPGVPRPPVFGTLRGGLGSLTDRLAKMADATIEFGQPVRRLRRRRSAGPSSSATCPGRGRCRAGRARAGRREAAGRRRPGGRRRVRRHRAGVHRRHLARAAVDVPLPENSGSSSPATTGTPTARRSPRRRSRTPAASGRT